MPLVKQKLITLPEHLSSPPFFLWCSCCYLKSLVFCVVFCKSLFVLYLLTIVLSVLWFTDSDYSLIYWFWLPFDLLILITLWFTDSDYSLIYWFWLLFDLLILITLWFTDSDYSLIYWFWLLFDLLILITLWFTDSDYSLIYWFWLLFRYLQTFLTGKFVLVDNSI